MLLNENLINYLSVHTKAQNVYGTSSFRFNSSQKLVHNTAQQLKTEYRKLIACFVVQLLALAQLIFGARNASLVIALENFFIVLAAFVLWFLK